MRSMTGFGRAETQDFALELRAVNSRYLDCSFRLPRTLLSFEDRIKAHLQARGVRRGKIELTVTASGAQGENAYPVLDTQAVQAYLTALGELRDGFGLRDDISVMSVAQNKDLFKKEAPQADPEKELASLFEALDPAIDAFLLTREAEGARLAADIEKKLNTVGLALDRIEKSSVGSVENYRKRLTQRVREALADGNVTPDEGRLLTECAVYADRIAIDEELVRLRAHIASFEEIAAMEDGVGRRLDFLMQEMNREANTIGSKCADAAVAREVVEIKSELEKIREQIQNIE